MQRTLGRCRGCERAGGSWVAASRVRLAPRRCGAPGARAVRPSGAGAAAADGKIRASCMIRGVRAAKRVPSWQDLRAVYPLTVICRAFRIHGAHILPKPARFGCMARESCRELVIFPSEVTFGIHGAQNLPRIAARERTAAKSCHGLPSGNAPRENIATVGCRGTHFACILPSVSARNAAASCAAASPMLAPNAPPMPYVPVAHAPAPPATAPRRHVSYAALLSPLKK